MAENNIQRLFFALWPDDGVREKLVHLTHRQIKKSGKPVAFGNLHITLFFLGHVERERRKCLESMADEVKCPPFTLRMGQLGWWPRPRVLWVAPPETPEALRTLVALLGKGCDDCGFQPDKRPYKAHVTLARKVSSPPQMKSMGPIEWPVADFRLVESKTLPSGAEYTVLRSWSLVSFI